MGSSAAPVDDAAGLADRSGRRALRDPLTGLASRGLLRRLERLLGPEGRPSGDPGGGDAALLLLDIDRFRLVNGGLGHGAGNRVLEQLGRQQMRRACRRVVRWQASGEAPSDLRLHLNLSMGQVDDPALVDDLRRTLERTGLPARRQWLEITESATMRRPARLREIRQLGARLAVDDFGTRHSTLAQLRRLDLDGLKIDRTFVAGPEEDARDRAIVESVVTLGRSLGLQVVAEEVETRAQLEDLEEMDCHCVQGFLVGRPAGADRVAGGALTAYSGSCSGT